MVENEAKPPTNRMPPLHMCDSRPNAARRLHSLVERFLPDQPTATINAEVFWRYDAIALWRYSSLAIRGCSSSLTPRGTSELKRLSPFVPAIRQLNGLRQSHHIGLDDATIGLGLHEWGDRAP